MNWEEYDNYDEIVTYGLSERAVALLRKEQSTVNGNGSSLADLEDERWGSEEEAIEAGIPKHDVQCYVTELWGES